MEKELILCLLHRGCNEFFRPTSSARGSSSSSASHIPATLAGGARPIDRTLDPTQISKTFLVYLLYFAKLGQPVTPLGNIFGFGPLPVRFFRWMAGIVALYVVLAEVTKRIFYRKVTIQR